MNCEQFEKETRLTPREAAALLGMNYQRYMEFRRGDRPLKPYYVASMKAHALLPQTKVRALLEDSEVPIR